jgi:hypothetical protein
MPTTSFGSMTCSTLIAATARQSIPSCRVPTSGERRTAYPIRNGALVYDLYNAPRILPGIPKAIVFRAAIRNVNRRRIRQFYRSLVRTCLLTRVPRFDRCAPRKSDDPCSRPLLLFFPYQSVLTFLLLKWI